MNTYSKSMASSYDAIDDDLSLLAMDIADNDELIDAYHWLDTVDDTEEYVLQFVDCNGGVE